MLSWWSSLLPFAWITFQTVTVIPKYLYCMNIWVCNLLYVFKRSLLRIRAIVNFTNIFRLFFVPISFCQKFTNCNCKYRKNCAKHWILWIIIFWNYELLEISTMSVVADKNQYFLPGGKSMKQKDPFKLVWLVKIPNDSKLSIHKVWYKIFSEVIWLW